MFCHCISMASSLRNLCWAQPSKDSPFLWQMPLWSPSSSFLPTDLSDHHPIHFWSNSLEPQRKKVRDPFLFFLGLLPCAIPGTPFILYSEGRVSLGAYLQRVFTSITTDYRMNGAPWCCATQCQHSYLTSTAAFYSRGMRKN